MMDVRKTKKVIEELKRQRQSIAWDANVNKLLGADYPHAINSALRYDELTALIDELEASICAGE